MLGVGNSPKGGRHIGLPLHLLILVFWYGRNYKRMAEVSIVKEAIDGAVLEAKVSADTNGAVCSFNGQVRRTSRGRDVAYLEYDAYVPMAEKMLRRIAEEAEMRWGCQVVIQHRIGRIALGECSVFVAVGSPHRVEAFAACRHCIDTLKETVPIWKREVCPDGSYWIEGEEAIEGSKE